MSYDEDLFPTNVLDDEELEHNAGEEDDETPIFERMEEPEE